MKTSERESTRRAIAQLNVILGCCAVLGVGCVAFFSWAISMEKEWGQTARERAMVAPSAITSFSSGAITSRAMTMPAPGQDGSFVLRSSGLAAMQGAPDDAFLDEIDDTLGSCLPEDEKREGAAIRLVAAGANDAGVGSSHILALEYKPPGGVSTRFYEYVGQEVHGYYDASGTQACSTGWRSPLANLRRTSAFNPRRMHPILRRPMPHQGTDFGAPKGTPVYAAYRGTVKFVGAHGAHGNWVSILHPDGTETGYAHLSKFAQGLKTGEHVRAHQLIGYVGSTGRSTGPHLHFSAQTTKGTFFDAETLISPAASALPESERLAFLKVKAELDQRLNAVPLPAR